MDLKMILDLDLINQIKLHKEFSKKIEELEEKKRILGLSIMQQMKDKTFEAPGFIVRRYSRISIKVSLQQARIHQATKLEEIIDKDKIKNLYHSGQSIEGVGEIHYIQISEK